MNTGDFGDRRAGADRRSVSERPQGRERRRHRDRRLVQQPSHVDEREWWLKVDYLKQS